MLVGRVVDQVDLVLAEAAARVGDPDLDAIDGAGSGETDGVAVRGVAQGVLDQGVEAGPQALGRAVVGARVRLDAPAPRCDRCPPLGRLPQHGVGVDALERGVALQADDADQTLGDPGEAHQLVVDHVQVATEGRVVLASEDELEVPAGDRQRGAQLVRGQAGQPLAVLGLRADPLGHHRDGRQCELASSHVDHHEDHEQGHQGDLGGLLPGDDACGRAAHERHPGGGRPERQAHERAPQGPVAEPVHERVGGPHDVVRDRLVAGPQPHQRVAPDRQDHPGDEEVAPGWDLRRHRSSTPHGGSSRSGGPGAACCAAGARRRRPRCCRGRSRAPRCRAAALRAGTRRRGGA